MLQRMQGGVIDQIIRVRTAMTQVIGGHITVHAADIDAGEQDIVIDGKACNAGNVIHKRETSFCEKTSVKNRFIIPEFFRRCNTFCAHWNHGIN